jgi:hypothetical protein
LAYKRPHERRHREWATHQTRWRWLVDSLEGGDTYRYATYGTDGMGYPARNLVRHKREYESQNLGQAYGYGGGNNNVPSTNSDYDLRLVRTPVPTMVPEVVDDHLSRIYAKEVRREAGPDLAMWWEDVDGAGTPVDSWMQTEVAPLLYTLGTLDILIDHPPAPEGVEIRTLADQQALGMDAAVASILLPQNVVWWALNPDRSYAECVVREMVDDPDDSTRQVERFRHWTADSWALYEADGRLLGEDSHPFGVVPIIRLTLDRKALCEAIGRTPIEAVAERQREVYNLASELILSDTQQAHPLLQGPEDYIAGDGTIPIGPSWLLPKKKSMSGTSTSYEGFEIIDFPKGGSDSIRQNMQGHRDTVDRAAGLAKPAGESGTGAGTVAQSGISKAYDQSTLVNLLGRVANHLQMAEVRIARLAMTVLTNGMSDRTEEILVLYPRQYDVHGAAQLAEMAADIQATIGESGRVPTLETQLVMGMVQIALPGLDDATMAAIREEVETAIVQAGEDRAVNRQVNQSMLSGTPQEPTDGEETDPEEAEPEAEDPAEDETQGQVLTEDT